MLFLLLQTMYGPLCISAEDRLHVLCVLCVHVRICTCQYVYIPTTQPIKVRLDVCSKQAILILTYSLHHTQIQWNLPITELQGTEIFFHGRTVPFNRGTWSLNPWDSRYLGLWKFSTKDRLPFRTGFTVFLWYHLPFLNIQIMSVHN
jgi:hypothetical protein